MFGRQIPLFELFGFKVSIDFSWFLLAILISWSLATGFFPFYYPDLGTAAYWWMGIAGALGLFFSIIFHEFSHSLVARRFDLPISGITLFIFGGVAHMEREPETPKSEFLMAVAGPIASFVLGGVFYLLLLAGAQAEAPVTVLAVLNWLAVINIVLAVFNLVPAFPLDGGRMLRAALWGWKGRLRWASRISYRIGAGFGILLVVLGLLQVVVGNFVGGLWWFLIGLFIRAAAGMTYQQALTREAIKGVSVRRIMNQEPITVPSSTRVQSFVDDYLYRYFHRMFPVVDDGRLLGCVSMSDVKELDRAGWSTATVADIMQPLSPENTIEPDTDAIQALKLLSADRARRLMVVRDKKLLGVLTLKDLMMFITLRLDLEGEDEAGAGAAAAAQHERLSEVPR